MVTDDKVKQIVKDALEDLVNDDEKMKVMTYATQITPTVFKMLEEQRKELIAEFREFAPELISRFGFDDQMDNAMEFTKKRFALVSGDEQ